MRALQQEAQQLHNISTQLDVTLQHARDHLAHITSQYVLDDDW